MRRKTNVFIVMLALVIGALVYIVLRENAYISKIFRNNHLVTGVRVLLDSGGWYVVSCYLPDFLWGLGLTCGLMLVFEPSKLGCVYCALVGILCGVVWETLQILQIVFGTGDILDIFMYISAATISFFINIKGERNDEEK